jgi:TrmH family RNA methyltransferase
VAAARLHRARGRLEAGLTLVEGPHVLAEALSCGIRPETVFYLEEDGATPELIAAWPGADVELVPVTPAVLARVAGTEHPRGPVAVIPVPATEPASGRDVVMIEVGEPGNAGTLIRSAAAFGFDVVFSPGAVDPWSPKVVRGAAGGHFHARLVDATSLHGRAHLVSVVADGLSVDQAMSALDGPIVLVVGNETRGAEPVRFGSTAVPVTIPMVASLDSLNASVAGSILMYEIAKHRAAFSHR